MKNTGTVTSSELRQQADTIEIRRDSGTMEVEELSDQRVMGTGTIIVEVVQVRPKEWEPDDVLQDTTMQMGTALTKIKIIPEPFSDMVSINVNLRIITEMLMMIVLVLLLEMKTVREVSSEMKMIRILEMVRRPFLEAYQNSISSIHSPTNASISAEQ